MAPRPNRSLTCASRSADAALPWSAPAVASGASYAAAAGRQLWRVTFRDVPNLGDVSAYPTSVKVQSTDPFAYWPTGIGEWYAIVPVPGARCVFPRCVQPNASSDLGVWLVVD